MKKIKQNKSWIITIVAIIFTFTILVISLYSNSVTVKVNQLNLRTGPAVTYKVKEKVTRGTRLQVIDRKDNWIKVISNNRTIGWVASWLVTNGKIKDVSKLSEATIVIDPGHGGSDSGALSTTGLKEKTYTLQVATKVANLLREKGANVIMTRDTDKTVSLAKRPAIAMNNSANAFISFHFDSSDEANVASGFTCYYYHKGQSLQLAKTINDSMDNLSLANRGVEFGDFLVIRDTSVPSILIEGGYINDDNDIKKIKSADYQNQYAEDVVDGLSRYFATQQQ
ncbi:N-acetylmuramoyl-L-alanine amidase [Lentilactobacillus sp. Marseille-Q4993]|uniref:N-acetylmuramoyl-L-alanine amidase n=1 Tax=Lentilactobacillus sp. Marseille-Q4993 TaxID=3039492 RepID=UPI0024BCF6C1|nr:N-acetylmuramoyl-L-alanine amidase [Lentilactobacillus sp. Marseille-Q4993]